MRYITNRKRAEGKGTSHTGTEQHWQMQLSAVGLALIVPTFVYVFGSSLGASHDQVLRTFGHPIPAILMGLVLVFGLQHFKNGATIMIEDYWRGSTRKALIMFTTAFTYGLAATGLFALVKMAL